MKFQSKSTDVTKVEADIVIILSPLGKEEKGFILSEEARKVDGSLGGMLAEVAKTEDFEAKEGSTLLIHSHGKIAAERILLVGLGNPKDLTVADFRVIGAIIGRKSKTVAARRIAIVLPESIDAIDVQKIAESLTIGLRLGTYVFNRHKNREEQKKEKYIDVVTFLVKPSRLDGSVLGSTYGQTVADAVSVARDLVNEPPSTTTPTHLSEVAVSLSKKSKEISTEVFGTADMKALGMHALLGIARGSDEEPKFIKLIYRGGRKKTVCLVGKGITFDTGGLSLKPSENMETMKMDMAGAAAILGIFSVLPFIKPSCTVVGLIAATENMPGPKAIKPGDIVKAMNGKTIEILNTDAEGRVILADALSYAEGQMKPDILIDLATLTGACMVALGEDIAGIFSNTKDLAESLKKSALQSGENLWELPLAKEYKEQLKSTVADIRNISKTRYGGAINGALFLQEFVRDGTSWAHLDIAGPAFSEKDIPLTPYGGTGFGVALLLEYLRDLK